MIWPCLRTVRNFKHFPENFMVSTGSRIWVNTRFLTNVKASRFTCQLKILNTIIPITPGLPVMFYSRGNAIDATIKKLNATLDKNGANLKSRPKVK